MKTVISDTKDVLCQAAEHIKRLVAAKPGAVLALSGGRTAEKLYGELARLYAEGELSLKNVKVFAVTEYEGAPEALTCRRTIEEGLIDRTDLREENCVFLNRERLDIYDNMIEQAGGIDLAVLGIGVNAHIGFNEPATPYLSYTHAQKLTDATRRQNAELFGGEDRVPVYGLTMGIKTISEAREVILLALGGEKAEAVHRMVYGRTDSAVPAAFLQLPQNVEAFLDTEAAGGL